MSAEQPALEELLGYRFQRPELLQRALTHRSSIYEKNSQGRRR